MYYADTIAMERRAPAVPLGLVGFLATTIMLFTTFAASYLVRRTSADWRPVELPPLAWANLLLLAGASATLERACRAGAAEARRAWLGATAGLGIAFLVGQSLALGQLRAAGIFAQTSPHASFFLVLSLVHGAHLAGGLGALLYGALRPAALRGCAAFWHTIGVIWLALLIFLSVM